MNSIAVFLISFGSILMGTLGGFALAKRLPVHHLNNESQDAVKMAWGIVASMSALVLGLLLSSAKSSFDFVNTEMTQSAAKIIVLDQYMDSYGPETKLARAELRNRVAIRIQKIWPDKPVTEAASTALETGRGMRAVLDRLNELKPVSDTQHEMLSDARQLTGDLMMVRWLAVEESRDSLPTVFFFVLVLWLTILFLGIGLYAPYNRTVLIAMVLCNLSVSAAIFLIYELDQPLDGYVKISKAPMQGALDYLDRQATAP